MTKYKLVIKKNKEFSLLNGHPWVFKDAIKKVPDDIRTGDTVSFISQKGRYVGQGIVDTSSRIFVRMINCSATETIDVAIKRLIASAINLRQSFFPNKATNAYRLINGEGDGIPGLIIDKYADAIAIQIYTLALEPFLDVIKSTLLKLLPNTKWIWRRNQIRLATSSKSGLIFGKNMPEKILFNEYGMKFSTDLVNGQKTGFFLDQRENRNLIKSISRGKNLLNVCGYTGAFTVAAAMGGATQSTTVDIARPALEEAERNFELNHMQSSKHKTVCEDMYTFMEKAESDTYDLIVLDPPSMAKNRNDLTKAMRAYRKLNKLGFKLVKSGGYIFTASCTSQLTRETFYDIIKEVAGKSGRQTKIVHESFHAPDHPISTTHPEGKYLKAFLIRVE